MLSFHKIYSSVFGIGFLKGGGTYAAIFCCILWYLAWHGSSPPLFLSLTLTGIITLLGVWSSSVVEKTWGKDPSKVVIDEVAGMAIGLLFIPVELKYLITGLIFFRFFDIVKPLFVRRMEVLPSGWGIMMDDVLSGVYTNGILFIVVRFNLF